MSIDERDRRALWESLRDSLGADQADTLMTHLPASPLPELVTRQDMMAQTEMLRGEMAQLRAELKGDMAELRAEIRNDMAELRAEIRQDMVALRTELVRVLLMIAMGLGSLIVAVLGTILTLGFTGAFA